MGTNNSNDDNVVKRTYLKDYGLVTPKCLFLRSSPGSAISRRRFYSAYLNLYSKKKKRACIYIYIYLYV